MLINFNHLKTFFSALVNKMKGFRGNWCQNDPNADDYIKNRTHYVEMGETVILPLTTLNRGEVQLQQPLIKGQTYSITWDGVTYESVAREYDGFLMLGNNAIYDFDNGIETDTGEPFALEIKIGYNNAYIYLPSEPRVLDSDGSEIAQHTISITTYGEIVHKLDKKYIDIPEGIVTEESLYPILEDELAPVAFSNDYSSLSGRPTIYTDVVRYATTQSLTINQKAVARENIGAASDSSVIKYDTEQGLTDEQKAQARTNISAASSDALEVALTLQNIAMPNSRGWNSICYGNGRFVATAYNSSVSAYSDDGIAWIESPMPSATQYWCSVCYGSNKFVALSGWGMTSDVAAYSTDGITWTETTLPDSTIWESVCYGNGKFVAIDGQSNSRLAAYSEDGITWVASTLPKAERWRKVCYGNGKFVAACTSGTIAYSEDGISWSTANLPTSINVTDMCYGDGRFVMLGGGRDARIFLHSIDGINWSQAYMPEQAWWQSICYSNGKFVAVAGNGIASTKAAYSENGITWIPTSLPVSEHWMSVCYGDDKFVAITGYRASKVIAYSIDGMEWINNTIFYSDTDSTSEVATIISSKLPPTIQRVGDSYTKEESDTKYLTEQEQADWSQNDETAPDYVKNRTHYDYLTTIEQPFTIESSAGEQIIVIKNVSPENTTDLRIGHIHFHTAHIEKGATYFVYEDSTIKIRITFVEGDNGQCDAHWLLTPTSTYSAIAYHTFKEVHQLDKKYLPDDHINSLIDIKLGVIENGSY